LSVGFLILTIKDAKHAKRTKHRNKILDENRTKVL